MNKLLLWKDKLGRVVADGLGRSYTPKAKAAKATPSPSDLRAAAAALLEAPPNDDFAAAAQRAGMLLIAADAAEGKTPEPTAVDAEAERLIADMDAAATRP